MKKYLPCITALLFAITFFAEENVCAKTLEKLSYPVSHLSFTRNDGQIDTHGKDDCRYVTNVDGGWFYFCADGIVEDFQQSVVGSRLPVVGADHRAMSFEQTDYRQLTTDYRVQGHVLKLNFLHRTNFLAEINGEEEQEYKCNYFIGNVPSKWHANVPNYSRIRYHNVWEGIDVVYRSVNFIPPIAGQPQAEAYATLKYDVIVAPGADPSQIQFSYEGDDGISIKNGALVVKTSLGDMIEQTPYTYQIIDGVKKEITSSFIIHHSSFCIQVGSYDKTQNLIIDPVYSTYLGSGQDDAEAIEVDAGGNAYITGTAYRTDFPTTTGAYQTTNKGAADIFVIKINAQGSALVYSTLVGGVASDAGRGIAVDAGGNAYIVGSTQSTDFPKTPGAYDTTNGSLDGFVTKINAQGSALVYSTFLGGSRNDVGYGIAIDAGGNAYITGYTQSPDFPASLSAYQPVLKGTQNVFVTKVNSTGTNLVYSTFLGGAVNPSATGAITFGYAIAVDRNQNAYLTGYTTSSDFPTTPGAFQTSVQPPTKTTYTAFVAKINPSGDTLRYSTFLGGSSSDVGKAIAVDAGGNAYITGWTKSSNFPHTSGAYDTTVNGGTSADAFVTKINPSGDTLRYSTFLGGSDEEMGTGIAVDVGGNAYIAGYTGSSDFPTTLGAYQATKRGNYDVFVTKINAPGSDLRYSTFMGGSDYDYSYATAVDAGGNAYITGVAGGANFPTTPGAYQTIFKGVYDAFAAKFSLVPVITVVDTLAFDSVRCSQYKTLLIENFSADVALKIDTMTLGGPNSTNFSFVNLPQFPLTINPLDNATITLQVTRTGATGMKMATLSIHSNDDAPLSDTLKKVTLTGFIDSVGVITLEKKITFGQLRCEEVSFDTIVGVKNTGSQLTRIVPTVSGDGATSFTVTPADTMISAGDVGKFNVHFQPSGYGDFSAHIQFSSNDCGTIFDTTSVKGSKISSVSLSSSGSLLDFGERCHSSVVDSFITVHNTSSGTAILEHPVETGKGFTVTPNTSVTLAAGDSVRYQVRFISSGVGNYQGTITIGGKPCNINVSIQLRGTEIEPPKITLKPMIVDFETLDCNETERSSKVKMRNVGSRTITIKPFIMGDTSSYHIRPDTTFVLHPNEFRNITITFHPDSVGQKTAYLFFDDPLCGLLKDSVTLDGFKKGNLISGKPLSLYFDTVNCNNGETDTLSIRIKNTGDQTLNLNPPTVSGNGFAIDNASGVLGFAPGDTIEYRIIFGLGWNGESYLDTFRITGSCVSFTCPLVGFCSSTSGVENSGIESRRETFLGQNYPNPFRQLSVVSCQLPVISGRSLKCVICSDVLCIKRVFLPLHLSLPSMQAIYRTGCIYIHSVMV